MRRLYFRLTASADYAMVGTKILYTMQAMQLPTSRAMGCIWCAGCRRYRKGYVE
jgi:hypothetical protein